MPGSCSTEASSVRVGRVITGLTVNRHGRTIRGTRQSCVGASAPSERLLAKERVWTNGAVATLASCQVFRANPQIVESNATIKGRRIPCIRRRRRPMHQHPSEALDSNEREAPIGPSVFPPRNAIYFRTLILKSAGGSNNDREGSLNCTLVS